MATEFDLIDEFLKPFDRTGPTVRVGPGDDCAVLRPPKGRELVVTTDALVENVHFTREHFTLEDVGHKALAVNLSDLASMGARPEWFLCAIAMPRAFGTKEVRALAKGMSVLARAHAVPLVGGNFTGASELSLTITATGSVKPGRALLRNGARAGDFLYVSGTPGDARAGLVQLREHIGSGAAKGASMRPGGNEKPAARALVSRQRRPEPRLELGALATRFASSAIDVSDGLAQDLGHVCDASNVGALVELARLPLSKALLAHCHGNTELATRYALSGGEDYELLLTIPQRRASAFEAACARAGEPVTQIGRITRDPRRVFLSPTGAVVRPAGGFDHFVRGPGI